MYLKRLEMQGFKSFAKKADLSFNNNITIVVGPNGSGKSNIVDAIRWVLGEGSAKSLRGSKMEDVIFSGSTDKKPLGMAQVSLTLDNSTGTFPVDYSEIKITRKLFRSGESDYLINNVKCRQKDIHELIMDTGIGKDSFSIIGQGKVDQILLSQAEEKRTLIEEVAGISKYRYRKNEAKRKLADTENSLLRVKDIVRELETQKDPLKEQAEKAKKYKEYKNELDDLEIQLANYTIANLEKKSETIKKEIEEFTQENTFRETAILKSESLVEETSLNLENHVRHISETQNHIYLLNNEINDYQNKSDYSDKILENMLDNSKRVNEEKKTINEELQEMMKKEAEETKSFQNLFEEYKRSSSEFKSEALKIDNIKNSESGLNKNIQELKSDLFEYAHQLSEVRNKIIDLEKREAVISSGEEGIKNKLSKNRTFKEMKSKEMETIKEQISSIANDSKEIKNQILEISEEKKELVRKLKLNEEELKNKNKEKDRKVINKQALEALENNKEGYSAGVKSIFANKNLKGISGTIADLAETTPEYRLAIETALGGGIQNIVTEKESDAKIAIDFLREKKAGRATFLPLNVINERVKNKKYDQKRANLKLALEVMTFAEKYKGIFAHLLGGIYIAKDMDEAIKSNKGPERPVKIVTLKGEVIDPRGSMTGGQYRNNQEGFFLRKEKISNLTSEIYDLEKEISSKEKVISAFDAQLLSIEENIQELEINKNKIENKRQELENLKAQTEFQISEALKEFVLLESEEKGFKEEKDSLVLKKTTLKKDFSKLENEKKNKEELLQKIQNDAEEEKNTLFDLEKALGKMEIKYNDLRNKKDNKENLLEEIKNRKNGLNRKKQELANDEKEIDSKIKEAKENGVHYREKIKEKEFDLNEFSKKIENLREMKEEEEAKKRKFEEEVKKDRKVFEEVREKLHGKEINLEKYKTEIQNLISNLQERFDTPYERSFIDFYEDFNEKASKQRIKELRKYIEFLGEVNLIAISEYEKLMERYTFLSTQCLDLDEAKGSLTKIIDEMDHIIVKKFRDTFGKLNEAFKETFTEMFSGGTAEIIMTDKENILETGIEIVAQPPGKTQKPLSLLSGGEKAMTAICLLFAILKIKPGPFCILDEIEASLDESNVNRFAGFLKKFAELTQFIVISHRKGTMEAGDILYGVTMEEKGISSLISVRISETIKLTS